MIRRLITTGYILLGCSFASLSLAQELIVHQQHAVGVQPRAVISADFNADARPDIATANFGDGTVSVLLSDGAGGYLAAASYFSGQTSAATPMSLVSAEFDDTPGPDILVINREETTATLLANNGTGSFSQPNASFDIGSTPVHVITGQFNAGPTNPSADNFPDILVVNRDTTVLGEFPSVRLFLNDGTGIFALQDTYEVDQSPEYAITGDFNHDGLADVIVANNRAQSISFLAGDGAGSFALAVNTALAFRPLKLTSGDFNNDGFLDLVGLHINSDLFSYLPGRGDGTFIMAKGEGTLLGVDSKTLKVGHTPSAIVSHDFDQDGNLDLAIGHLDSHNLLIVKGQGNGNFWLDENFYGVGAGPAEFILADFNNDTIQDIISANLNGNTVSTIVNNGDGTMHTLKLRPINTDFHSIASADFNGDGLRDLASIKPDSNDVQIKLRKFGQTFAPSVPLTLDFTPQFIAISDIDDSGTDDLLANDGIKNYTGVLSSADGSFQTSTTYTLSIGDNTKLAQMQSADFNADGFADLVITEENKEVIAYLQSNGEEILPSTLQELPVGKIDDEETISITNKPSRVIVNDFNNDTTPDLVTLNRESSTVTQLLSTPQEDIIPLADDGTRLLDADGEPEPIIKVPSIPLDERYTPEVIPYPIHAISSIDYNLDLLPDLLISRSDSHQYLMFGGNIDGSFDSAVPYDIDLITTSLTTGDFNGDGIPDIAAIVEDSSIILSLYGNGDGSFRPGILQKLGSFKAQKLLSSDINGDSFTDLIIATSQRNIRFMLNDEDGSFTTHQIRTSNSATTNLIEILDKETGARQVAASSPTTNLASVYTDQGGGIFSPNNRTPVIGTGSYGLAAKDMNSDNILDIISLNYSASNVTIIRGTGQGTYTSGLHYDTGAEPIALAVEDFDNDSFYDVATANALYQTITIVRGIDSSSQESMLDIAQTTTIDLSVGNSGVKATPVHMISTDINQDGLFDLAVLLKEPAALQIYMNNGGMNFTPMSQPIPVGPEPKYIHTDDINLDGGIDFIIIARQISTILNEGKFFPDPFTIRPITGQLTNSLATSAPIAITGIANGSAQINIVNGSYSLDGVTFTTRPSVAHNFDAIHVRTKTAGSANTTTSATLMVGGYSDTFSATTISDGTLPGAFEFTPVFDKPLSRLDSSDDTDTTITSTFVESNEVTITGLTQATSIAISHEVILMGKPEPTTEVEVDALYSINGQEFTKEPGIINNDDTLVVKLAASHEYETKTYATITIGGVSADFSVTTQADTEPNIFYLPEKNDLLPTARVLSPWVTVSGITAPTSISIKNGLYDTDLLSDTYTDEPSTIPNGRKFRILAFAPKTYDTPLDITVTLGGIDSKFTIRTRKNPNVAAAEEQARLSESIKEQSLFGCSLSANRNNAVDPTLPALVIGSLIVLWRRRKTLH